MTDSWKHKFVYVVEEFTMNAKKMLGHNNYDDTQRKNSLFITYHKAPVSST